MSPEWPSPPRHWLSWGVRPQGPPPAQLPGMVELAVFNLVLALAAGRPWPLAACQCPFSSKVTISVRRLQELRALVLLCVLVALGDLHMPCHSERCSLCPLSLPLSVSRHLPREAGLGRVNQPATQNHRDREAPAGRWERKEVTSCRHLGDGRGNWAATSPSASPGWASVLQLGSCRKWNPTQGGNMMQGQFTDACAGLKEPTGTLPPRASNSEELGASAFVGGGVHLTKAASM